MNKLIWLISFVLLLTGCGSRINSLAVVMDENIDLPGSRINEQGDLVGIINADMLLKKYKGFRFSFENFQPDPAALNFLSGQSTKITIVVILGTWCSDSEQHVGELIKILSLVKKWPYELILVGIDRKKSTPHEIIQHFSIQKVPTVICFKGKKEIGRIIEHPKLSMEQDLLNILTTGE